VTCCAKGWYVYDFKIHSKADREHEENTDVFVELEEDLSSHEDSPTKNKAKTDISALAQHVLDIVKKIEGRDLTFLHISKLFYRFQTGHKHGQLVHFCKVYSHFEGSGFILPRSIEKQQSSYAHGYPLHQV
jgi:hypothetical protein